MSLSAGATNGDTFPFSSRSPESLRALFGDEKLKPDFGAVLKQWGWQGKLEDLFAAAASQAAPLYTNANLVSFDARTRTLVVRTNDGQSRTMKLDDDVALAEMIGIVLRSEGFEPLFCAHGDEALEAFRGGQPDLVLLDLMLPGKDGTEICRLIRAESGVPIVMLTAKSDTIDVVVGLESGADDYVVKPFKPKELVARIRARLRRTEEPVQEQLEIGDLVIDVAGHAVKRDGQPIALTPLEFDLLVALARKPWQVFTREVLLEQVWGYRHAGDTRLVNVHVQRLRSKIEQDPEHPEIVVTVRGVGYKAGPS